MAADSSSDRVLPQVDFEVDRLTVVVLFEGPRRAEYGREEAQRLANAHVQHVIGLANDGYLLHAGALVDEGSEPTLTGLGFSRLSVDELRPLIAKDPAMVAGMEAFRLVTYVSPKAGLGFPRAAAREQARGQS